MITLGQTVGNYRVTSKIGEGGMGAVYLAEHPVIGRRAALKVIHPQYARNAEVLSRFVTEATAISRIGHDHIVEVTDFGRTPDGDFYFIMEYLDGRPLSEIIDREAPLLPERAVTIAAQIADALAASHAHGVVHRDIKPENIFLAFHGDDRAFVKVLDFGLAKLIRQDGGVDHRTGAGVVMGTPLYMSPEQCRGRGEVDHRADIYALGVVLFEMLTGKLPFNGSYGDVLLKQMTAPPPALRSLVPDLPAELQPILDEALAKEPDQRFATMAAFRDALLRIGRRAEDVELAVIPRYRGRRAVGFLTGAAFAGALAAAVITRRTALEPLVFAARAAPGTVAVTFSSDPTGATVVDATGAALGATPLSTKVQQADDPVAFTLRKDGFSPESISLVPNRPSSLFASLRALPRAEPAATPAAAEPDDDPPLPRRIPAVRRHREPTAQRARDDLDEDGVLQPSFLR